MSWDEMIFNKCNDDRRRHEDKRNFFEDNLSCGRNRNNNEDREQDNKGDLNFTGKGRKSLFGLTVGATVNVSLSNGLELESIFQGIVGDFTSKIPTTFSL